MNNKTMLENALLYLELGWSVIPVNLFYKDSTTKAQKKPMVNWSMYQNRLPTEEEVTDWWTKWPNAGIGIVTGEISNLVIEKYFLKCFIDLHRLFQLRPGRNYGRVYFRALPGIYGCVKS